MTPRRPGVWARKVAPKWCFTLFDTSERLSVSVRRVVQLIEQHKIPTSLIVRRVRLADGSIRSRRLRLLTPTALETLMLRHAGFPKREAQARKS